MCGSGTGKKDSKSVLYQCTLQSRTLQLYRFEPWSRRMGQFLVVVVIVDKPK